MSLATLPPHAYPPLLTDEAVNGDDPVMEEFHYYPFGMRMEGDYFRKLRHFPAKGNAYQYNGKELYTDLGFDWMPYGARYYDAAVGRFVGVDPLADQFAWVSVYNYAENSPIANIDLHGFQKVSINDINSGGQIHRRDVNVSVNMKVINLSSRDDFRFNTELKNAPPLAAREFRTSFKQRIVTDPKVGLLRWSNKSGHKTILNLCSYERSKCNPEASPLRCRIQGKHPENAR